MKPEYKRGDLVSVWHRDSKRHKWLCEFSLVRLLLIDDRSVLVQTSETGKMHRQPNGYLGMTGATGLGLRGVGKWERELREPVYS